MRNSRRSLFVKTLLRVASSAGLLATLLAGAAQAQIVATATTPVQLTAGEPVVTTLTIRNLFREDVTVNLGYDRQRNIVLQVKDPGGEISSRTVPVRDGVGRRGRVAITQGDTYEQQILLSDWGPWEQEGVYEVTIAITGRVEGESGRAYGAPSPAPIRVVIAPRDEAALRQTAARLMQSVLTARSAQSEIDAERALTSMADPVIVPFLGEILDRSTMGHSRVIQALGRIGTLEAVEILRAAWGSTNEERAALAGDAIRRLEAARDSK